MHQNTKPVRHGQETRELTLFGHRIYRTRHTFPINDSPTPPSVQRTRARANQVAVLLLIAASAGGAAIVPHLPI